MRRSRGIALLAGTLALAIAIGSPAFALPTMVRLGYGDCVSCHISPQGGGPLNAYGRGIDRAQSLRAGEYRPSGSDFVTALNLRGRITHDLRGMMPAHAKWVGDQRAASAFGPRLLYRNVTDVSDGFRLSATVTCDPAKKPSALFVNEAMVHYRVGNTLELAGGRGPLPSGVNVPDLALFIKSRNRLGYYDAPTQLKMFWRGRRHAFTSFAYVPGSRSAGDEGESGGGALYEFDALGRQRTLLGVTLVRGATPSGDRRMVGAYARLGFGRWGILAEHDVTERTRKIPDHATSQQGATYAHVFWAMREWLVASAIGERLHVSSPLGQHLAAGKLEVAARLASQATVLANTRIERDLATGRMSRSVGLQIALKTVD